MSPKDGDKTKGYPPKKARPTNANIIADSEDDDTGGSGGPKLTLQKTPDPIPDPESKEAEHLQNQHPGIQVLEEDPGVLTHDELNDELNTEEHIDSEEKTTREDKRSKVLAENRSLIKKMVYLFQNWNQANAPTQPQNANTQQAQQSNLQKNINQTHFAHQHDSRNQRTGVTAQNINRNLTIEKQNVEAAINHNPKVVLNPKTSGMFGPSQTETPSSSEEANENKNNKPPELTHGS